MKYIDEYRDGEQARHIAAKIAAEVRPGRTYSFMEFCGGHTHAISRYGIGGMLPGSVRMIHGPGCPVVLGSARIGGPRARSAINITMQLSFSFAL